MQPGKRVTNRAGRCTILEECVILGFAVVRAFDCFLFRMLTRRQISQVTLISPVSVCLNVFHTHYFPFLMTECDDDNNNNEVVVFESVELKKANEDL